MADASIIEIGAIGATEVNQPKFVLALRMHHCVAARYFIVTHNDLASSGASQTATAANRYSLGVRRFQPGSGQRLVFHARSIAVRTGPIQAEGRAGEVRTGAIHKGARLCQGIRGPAAAHSRARLLRLMPPPLI